MEAMSTNTEHPHYLRFALETTGDDCNQLSVEFIGQGDVIVHAIVRAMQTNETIRAAILQATRDFIANDIEQFLTKED